LIEENPPHINLNRILAQYDYGLVPQSRNTLEHQIYGLFSLTLIHIAILLSSGPQKEDPPEGFELSHTTALSIEKAHDSTLIDRIENMSNGVWTAISVNNPR
jgi:hypothetical protein